MTTSLSLLLCWLTATTSAFVLPLAPQRPAAACTSTRPRERESPPSAAFAASATPTVAPRARDATMGLFGLGTPEIAIIAGVALLVLGPDQVKKLAKDVGKISAELKQVPEEFSKGMEVGQQELAQKKEGTETAAVSAAPAAPASPPTPPPTPPAA
jgi:sec-independent protein translocase protein TatA